MDFWSHTIIYTANKSQQKVHNNIVYNYEQYQKDDTRLIV